MHAEVSIRRIHQALEIVERQSLVCGQCADDTQAEAFVYQPVESRGRVFRLGVA